MKPVKVSANAVNRTPFQEQMVKHAYVSTEWLEYQICTKYVWMQFAENLSRFNIQPSPFSKNIQTALDLRNMIGIIKYAYYCFCGYILEF